MQVPLELTFTGMEGDDRLRELVRDKARKLDQVCDDLISCRVAVEAGQSHRQTGRPFQVLIELRVPPGHDVAVNHRLSGSERHASVETALRQAFAVARRRLRDLCRRQRGQVKQHLDPARIGLVARIYPERGYGFLTTLDRREIYFHRHSVLGDDFGRLTIGTGVRFVEEDGDEGPMASSIRIVDKPGVRAERVAAAGRPRPWPGPEA